MAIRYNIAKNKRVDYLRFIFLMIIIFVCSIGFILLGALRIASNTQQFQDKKAELKSYEEQVENKKKINKDHKTKMDKIKNSWKRELEFANHLIEGKLFPYLEKLDQLEKLLPAGVFIKDLSLGVASDDRINFKIAAISLTKLSEAYKVFLNYNLQINDEKQKSGFCQANLSINLKE